MNLPCIVEAKEKNYPLFVMKNIKVAILLLAHKNKNQVERLIHKLSHKNVDIFVHIDKKASFSPEDLVVPENVFFTEKRIDACLFEFSLLEAEFELIRAAKKQGSYQYFLLLSGQCYPLQNIETIYKLLQESYPKPFIDIIALAETNYVAKVFRHICVLKRFKLNSYAFLKKHFSFKMYRILRYIPGGFSYVVSMAKELFWKSPRARLTKMGYLPCAGAQWWILPDNVIELMLCERENAGLCSAISDAFGCDETFFQTAMMKHKDACGLELDEQGNYLERRWFHIFDGGHPIILNKEHYDQLICSKMLFARKFDENVDSDILDMLDIKTEQMNKLDNNVAGISNE